MNTELQCSQLYTFSLSCDEDVCNGDVGYVEVGVGVRVGVIGLELTLCPPWLFSTVLEFESSELSAAAMWAAAA